jgi:Tol biopolymer transport system component
MDRLRWRIVLAVAVVTVAASGCTFVARVSVDANGVQGNAETNHPALDGDGRYVAFSSVASNLVKGDTNAREDVFVRDNDTHAVERVSVSSDGTEANGGSSSPAISDDGRYVAFDSFATNLVVAGGGPQSNVFVHDRQTGETTLVSPAGGVRSDISATGRYVAYIPLPIGQVVALFDRDTATVENFGAESNGTVSELSISDDANRVLVTKFEGFDNETALPILRGRVYDRAVDTTLALARPSAYSAKLSGDGHYVAYTWVLPTGTPGNPGPLQFPLMWQDLDGPDAGVISNGGVFEGATAISRDGRYVAFVTSAARVPDDTNGAADVYVWDRVAARPILVGTDAIGRPTLTSSEGLASFSGDGRYVGFSSRARHTAGDTNGVGDVFIRAVAAPTPVAAVPAGAARGASETISVTGSAFAPDVTVSFRGTGITVLDATWVSETELTVAITVAADASVGARDLVVNDPGLGAGGTAGSLGFCARCFTVS